MAVLLLGAAVCHAQRRDVSGAQVRRALARGVKAIIGLQKEGGRWPERYHSGGESCLATLALLQAGQPRESDPIRAAINQIRGLPHNMVYVVSLKIMVLAQADPRRYRREIERAAQWLIAAQTQAGLWSYRVGGMYDNSNSQFALLGLHAAAQAGVKIKPTVWRRARSAITRSQNADGGWGYRKGDRSYGSMTAAGVSGLLILGSVEDVSREKPVRNGVAPGCGKYKSDMRLAAGMQWLGRKFRPDVNPERNRNYTYYWLYAVERCGILSGRRYFGQHDWYREGAAFLVRGQRPDGRWTRELVNTCFAVLFLAKGHKPLLAQKLQWSADDAWNPDRNDLKHLVSFIDDKLGQPVAWQTIAFDAPLEEWLSAPILYIQGHTFPVWTPEQRAKVRRYVERGGVLLAEACCSRDAFSDGFRRFAAQTFSAHTLRRLGPEHAVYSAIYELEPGALEGMDVGCRTSIFLSPRDLSCHWEQARDPGRESRALQLGANIAAYAAGRHALRDRLDVITLPASQSAAAESSGCIDALRMAQIVHDGDWRADPLALVRLSEFLRDELALDVVTSYRPIRLTDRDLGASPILFLSGHYAFELSPDERRGLAEHIRRGGFLLAEACCGRVEFDGSVRAMLAQAFPNAPLTALAADHP
ncbi:MAG: DUF4159 domain-containing protein, partial [Planctomycetes bacterium]|nr:DUF4159 domain-containing protein [Planctomycetota bacterium]